MNTGYRKAHHIKRYTHNVVDDGNGYIDEWDSEENDGEWCKWEDVAPYIEKEGRV